MRRALPRRYAGHDKAVQYTANLDGEYEEVVMHEGGLATLRRFGRPVVTFKPTSGQVAKIRSHRGKLNITTAMIFKAQLAQSPYGR